MTISTKQFLHPLKSNVFAKLKKSLNFSIPDFFPSVNPLIQFIIGPINSIKLSASEITSLTLLIKSHLKKSLFIIISYDIDSASLSSIFNNSKLNNISFILSLKRLLIVFIILFAAQAVPCSFK